MRSRQDVFTAAYRGLRAQSWHQSTTDCPEICRYNGLGGRHCAIGWAFAVPSEFEGWGVGGLPEDVIPADLRDTIGPYFLYRLQWAHDGYVTGDVTGDMQSRLASVAAMWGLTIPPDDGQDPVLAP